MKLTRALAAGRLLLDIRLAALLVVSKAVRLAAEKVDDSAGLKADLRGVLKA